MHGSENQLLFRKLQHHHVAEGFAVAARHHEADQVVLAARRERQHQQEFRLVLPRERGHHIGGRHGLGAGRLGGGVTRQVPEVFLVVERLRIQHVVGAIDFSLHAEQRLGIARMPSEVRGHRRRRAEQVREEALIRGDDRIVGREDVQMGLAVIRVHGCLDRVADVIHASEPARIHAASVRMLLAGGVPVHHPHQASRVGDHQVRVRIPGEKSGQLVEPVGDLAENHHAAVVGQVPRE